MRGNLSNHHRIHTQSKNLSGYRAKNLLPGDHVASEHYQLQLLSRDFLATTSNIDTLNLDNFFKWFLSIRNQVATKTNKKNLYGLLLINKIIISLTQGKISKTTAADYVEILMHQPHCLTSLHLYHLVQLNCAIWGFLPALSRNISCLERAIASYQQQPIDKDMALSLDGPDNNETIKIVVDDTLLKIELAGLYIDSDLKGSGEKVRALLLPLLNIESLHASVKFKLYIHLTSSYLNYSQLKNKDYNLICETFTKMLFENKSTKFKRSANYPSLGTLIKWLNIKLKHADFEFKAITLDLIQIWQLFCEYQQRFEPLSLLAESTIPTLVLPKLLKAAHDNYLAKEDALILMNKIDSYTLAKQARDMKPIPSDDFNSSHSVYIKIEGIEVSLLRIIHALMHHSEHAATKTATSNTTVFNHPQLEQLSPLQVNLALNEEEEVQDPFKGMKPEQVFMPVPKKLLTSTALIIKSQLPEELTNFTINVNNSATRVAFHQDLMPRLRELYDQEDYKILLLRLFAKLVVKSDHNSQGLVNCKNETAGKYDYKFRLIGKYWGDVRIYFKRSSDVDAPMATLEKQPEYVVDKSKNTLFACAWNRHGTNFKEYAGNQEYDFSAEFKQQPALRQLLQDE